MTLEFDPVCIVNKPVQDAVGDCGVTDLLVPVSQGNLAGEDGGAGRVAVVADLQEVPAFAVGQWSHRPIIDDKNVDPGEPVEDFGEAAIDTRESKIAQQFWCTGIEGSEAVADGLLSQRAGEVTFADTGGAENQNVLMLGDPATSR